jgi:hypothetical protein
VSLFTIPFQVRPLHYSVVVVLSDENIERIRHYDPAEIVSGDITRALGEPWHWLTLRDVIVAYATTEELNTVTVLVKEGKATEALRLVTRGWQYRPHEGDGASPEVV